MNKWIEGSYNASKKYNADYAYNDEWVDCDWSWRILSDHKVETPEDIVDHDFRSNTLRIKTDEKVSKKILYRVLGDYFERGCSCEFDCCGHFFGGLRDLKKPTNRKSNEYIATVSYSPNY
jgi:hypothetical protein